MNFDTAFDRLIGNEGGYSNNPDDPGGETMWGITVAVARANGYTGPMRNMPRDTAKGIYRTRYWAAVHGDALPPAIAFQVFDAAVNHGTGQAARWLQASVGAGQDGVIGPITLGAVAKMDPAVIVMLFLSARLYFYPQLSTWSAFGGGWANRVANNLKLAAHDLGA